VGDVTITTQTDQNGNATVTTENDVTGESKTENVSVNNTATVENSGVQVTVNTLPTGTITTVPRYVIEYDDVLDVEEGQPLPDELMTEPFNNFPLVEDPIVQPVVQSVVPEVVTVPPTSYTPLPRDDDDEDPRGEVVPGYTSGIAGIGGAVMRPVVAPYYQPQPTGLYSFYRPIPGVVQTPTGPVFGEPTTASEDLMSG
jgi:hypothetical protein